MNRRKVPVMGVLLALALVFSYVESLIPFYFGVPGMKLGLTNTVVVLVLYLYGAPMALLISFLRIILSGFMFGNAFSIAYSLAGGLLSFFCMYLARRFLKLRMIGVSVVGGFTHNVGQIFMAVLLVNNYNVLFYLPILMIAGCLTGVLIGIIAALIHDRIRHIAVLSQTGEV